MKERIDAFFDDGLTRENAIMRARQIEKRFPDNSLIAG